MTAQAHPREGARASWCWASTFKENCPDLRNSKVADVVARAQEPRREGRRLRPWVDARRGRARIRHPADQAARATGATTRSCSRSATSEFREHAAPRTCAGSCKTQPRRSTTSSTCSTAARSTAGSDAASWSPAPPASSASTSQSACWRAATRWSASTTSTTTTIRRSSRRASRVCKRRAGLPLREAGSRRPARRWRRCSRARSFARVIHLAAQAGVRYSLENPHAYVDSNVTGTLQRARGLPPQRASSTWCTPRRARCTAPTPTCRSRCTRTSIIRCRSTPRPRRPTS